MGGGGKFERPTIELPFDPGIEMMTCEPQHARLTRRACARMYMSTLSGPRPEPFEARHTCVGCPIGAANSGNPSGYVTVQAQVWRNACCRCRQSAPRLINGFRCISCYNRHREAIRGRDRKGHRPRLIDRLYTAALVVFDGGKESRFEMERVVDASELLVTLARQAKGPLAFSRPAAAHAA